MHPCASGSLPWKDSVDVSSKPWIQWKMEPLYIETQEYMGKHINVYVNHTHTHTHENMNISWTMENVWLYENRTKSTDNFVGAFFYSLRSACFLFASPPRTCASNRPVPHTWLLSHVPLQGRRAVSAMFWFLQEVVRIMTAVASHWC